MEEKTGVGPEGVDPTAILPSLQTSKDMTVSYNAALAAHISSKSGKVIPDKDLKTVLNIVNSEIARAEVTGGLNRRGLRRLRKDKVRKANRFLSKKIGEQYKFLRAP